MKKKTKLTRSEIDGVQYRVSPMWRIALSQMANAGIMSIYVITTYVTYMANAGYGIATAVVGFLLTCTSIFDGITDPLAAQIVDNTKTKFGKVRILLFVGWGIISIALFMLFNVLSTGKFGIVTFIILYAIFILGYSIYDVAQRTISPLMTNDPVQRPIVSVWNTIFGFLTPTFLFVYIAIGVLPKYNNEYSVDMLKETCIIGIVISFVATLLSCIAISSVDRMENFEKLDQNEERVKLSDMIKMLKENKALQTFMISVTSDRIAALAAGQAVVATLLNGILLGDIQKATTLGSIIQLLAIVFAIIGAKHVGNHGSKESMKTWTIAQIVVTSILFVFYLIVGISNIFSSAILTAIYFVLNLCKSGFNMSCTTSVTAMTGDVVDYQNYKTGRYMPAAITATYSFIDKCISAFGTAIALGLIALAGYKNTMPQPTDPATTAIFAVTMFIVIGMPIIGWVVTLIALKFSPLSKEKMIEIQKTINERSENNNNQ